MKTNSILSALFILVCSAFLLPSCDKEGDCSVSNISAAGKNESHNFGQNCMTCHKSGGEGKGCFNAAGSVYNSALSAHLSSGTVKFYTQPNGGGTLKYTVAIDSKGNFYTTESNTYTGLYPAITGPNGTTNYMSTTIGSGACNSCHGASTSALFAN
jgi:cytochrome c553